MRCVSRLFAVVAGLSCASDKRMPVSWRVRLRTYKSIRLGTTLAKK